MFVFNVDLLFLVCKVWCILSSRVNVTDFQMNSAIVIYLYLYGWVYTNILFYIHAVHFEIILGIYLANYYA